MCVTGACVRGMIASAEQVAGGVRALALCIEAQDAAVALVAMNAVARIAADVPIKHNFGLLGCVPLLVRTACSQSVLASLFGV